MGLEKESHKIEKFDGTNFSFRKIQMEDYLYQKDLHWPIKEKPEIMTDEEWSKKQKPKNMDEKDLELLDRKALRAIRLSLTKQITFNVKDQLTARDMMKTLSNLYEQPSTVRKVHLVKKLSILKMTEGQGFREYLNQFNEVKDKLTSVSMGFDEEFLVVVNMIMTEEIRMREEGFGASTSSTLNMEGRESRNRNQNTNQRGRSKSRGKSKSRSEKKDKGKGSANCVSEESDDCLICSLESKTESWVLDSEGSFHATPHRGLFENYVSKNFEGYVTTFTDDKWKISKGIMTIIRENKNGLLYTATDGCGSIAMAEGKLPNLKSVEVDFCESCALGKQKRVSFKKIGMVPAKNKLELVHTDVWGPASVSSTGGKQYFVTFINDHSRKVWVYFLKHKSEVFDAFKRWKARVENETGLKIKKLHSDNGGEYKDSEFKRFCYLSGIKLSRTVPGTPQQNGIAECMNKILTERARSMSAVVPTAV
ncbi:hypothetical protein Q3G72_031677 [Acer saccharum]|nr:hypothetical protein Q3G72_031677 [Acer saccharum]